MSILEILNDKKKNIEILFSDSSQLKPYKLLKNLINEIDEMDTIFSKKEQLEMINKIFNQNISYNAFLQFTNYSKISKIKKELKPKRGKKEERTLKEPRAETIKEDVKTPSPVNEEIVAEKEDIFKLKPVNKNEGLKIADTKDYK